MSSSKKLIKRVISGYSRESCYFGLFWPILGYSGLFWVILMNFRAKAYTGYFGIFNMVSHWRLRNMKLTSILVIFRVIFVNRVIWVILGHFWSFLVILAHLSVFVP